MLRVLESTREREPVLGETLRALLQPRRLVPVAFVSATLVLFQRAYSREPRAAWLGAALCASFLLFGPTSFRLLFPRGVAGRGALARLVAYAAIAIVVVCGVGIALPRALGVGPTFMTARTSLPIEIVLFLAGGWGLGRDVTLEASLAHAERRAIALARDAEQAQLLALRAQLDPHFLFNTLNAIAEWCRTDGEVAERAVLELASLLRAALLGVKRRAWPLSDELRLVRSLFSLHLHRDPDMFAIAWDVPSDVEATPVPPMLLLPLAENAVKHGPARGHRGTIALTARREGAHVRVTIENPGPYRGPRPGSDGVPFVERRLAIAYGRDGALSLRGEGERTIAIVELDVDGPRDAS